MEVELNTSNHIITFFEKYSSKNLMDAEYTAIQNPQKSFSESDQFETWL